MAGNFLSGFTEFLPALFVGFGMAEIVSAIPTSGGPYFWAALLAPPRKDAFASWITGWQVAPNERSLAKIKKIVK